MMYIPADEEEEDENGRIDDRQRSKNFRASETKTQQKKYQIHIQSQ